MMNTFEAQGYMITVEGHDFGGNTADFDKVCADIERAAKTVDRAALAAIVWDETKDDFAGGKDTRFQEVAMTLCKSTLERLGWDRPYIPWVGVSADLDEATP
jgi:hypothetical protein